MTRSTQQKLLVIDDDPRMRDLIKEILASPGVEILEGGDGDEAVRLYREHHPDWVIMDLEMSPTGGIAATRSLVGENPSGRVVVLTRHDSPGFRKAAADAGARAYLVKDQLTELKSLLTRLSTEIS